MYVIQLSLVLLLAEIAWKIELFTFTKLFITLLCVTYFVFTMERRTGCTISKFSSLDLLVVVTTVGGINLSLSGFPVHFWFFMAMFAVWFGIRFVLCRTIYLAR